MLDENYFKGAPLAKGTYNTYHAEMLLQQVCYTYVYVMCNSVIYKFMKYNHLLYEYKNTHMLSEGLIFFTIFSHI